MSGLIIAAPASGSGKTTVTLALLRALRRHGVAAAPFKCGPDYIDPAFHAAAAGRPCYNLDPWAMRPATVAALIRARGAGVNIAEGVMGLFDGGPGGIGSTANLARATGWPVALVVDAAGMAQSAAALVAGFVNHDPAVRIPGVIFNRTGGAAHNRILAGACANLGVTVLGGVARDEKLHLPSRHLGLVQAAEHEALENFLNAAADAVESGVNMEAVARMAESAPAEMVDAGAETVDAPSTLPPLGGRIAVARDEAFAFCYPATLDSWRAAGAEIFFFSPLADEAPDAKADAVFLPGGYPELHAGRLAACQNFTAAMRAAAGRRAAVVGECGGYMVLGRALTDGGGEVHQMLNLLPVETSFAQIKMTLGYRRLHLANHHALGKKGAVFRGHEFHFATAVTEPGAPLFTARDAAGRDLGGAGCARGTVSGSFVHLVDRAE